MSDLIEVTPSVYECPLLTPRLLAPGVAAASTQYAVRSRYIDLDLRERVSRPARDIRLDPMRTLKT
ncbi:MAG: hypothetical protein J0H42_17815 [Rhizobiales bacterium]|nr:hypothetical protein [Hyphomicrobiales bacterium]